MYIGRYTGNAVALYEKLNTLIETQTEFSEKNFGTTAQRGPRGPLVHLAKEVLCEMLGLPKEWFKYNVEPDIPKEIPQIKTDEWGDLFILLLDALRRDGHTFRELVGYATDKMKVNLEREWPAFDPAKSGEAVEHVKEELIEGFPEGPGGATQEKSS